MSLIRRTKIVKVCTICGFSYGTIVDVKEYVKDRLNRHFEIYYTDPITKQLYMPNPSKIEVILKKCNRLGYWQNIKKREINVFSYFRI